MSPEGRSGEFALYLRMFVRVNRQSDILNLAGKVRWEGNLDEMREGRSFDDSGR